MFESELKEMIEASKIARDIILEIYKQDFSIQIKSDNSPVTQADIKSDEAIREYLHEKFPSYAFLTEESFDNKERLNNDFVFIIDPLDGTADFVDRNGEFTINIALSYKHNIVAGVVCIPVRGIVYYALKNNGSFKLDLNTGLITKIHVSNKTKDITCLTSRFHTSKGDQKAIEKNANKIAKIDVVGSSIKACYIAEGLAEISYRLSGGTKEWDTAAFDIVVTEAGGFVLKPNFEPIKYNREEVRNLEGYVIANNKENIIF